MYMISDMAVARLAPRLQEALEGLDIEIPIEEVIREAVRSTRPFPTYEITGDTRKEVEKALYSLPELCEKLEEAEGLDALLISWKIRDVKRALELIQDDPYYPLIPARYFDGADERTAAFLCSCDKATIWRNRKRLLDRMAVYLFGAAAFGVGARWEETRIW